jgi:hypothetical protein
MRIFVKGELDQSCLRARIILTLLRDPWQQPGCQAGDSVGKGKPKEMEG